MGLSSCLILLINLIILAASFCYMQPICHENEGSALLSFKGSFSILKSASHSPYAYPKLASWTNNGAESNRNCCSWDGVECDEDTGHVIGLDLSSSFLFGSINSTSNLFHLYRLQSLNLADNDFNYSHIPTSIGRLSSLTYLNLYNCSFSGQIPLEISQLTSLLYLDLSSNKLEMTHLRSLVHNLSSLQHLNLSYVKINSVVPKSLSNLSSLMFLDLTDCGLRGDFPIDIFQLPNLEFLNVRFNQELSGRLPEFNSWRPLKTLRLGDTRFYGELPSSIANLDALTELRIQGCNFSGSIPFSLGNNLTRLTYLDLANNSFHGQIPSSMQNLTHLRFLQLRNNEFSSQNLSTLSWIGKLPRLFHLDLVKTKLSSSIPSSFSNLTKLSTFRLAYNQLTGSVPLWLLNLTQLTDLYLSKNHLSGALELEKFINHSTLSTLRLSYNDLSLVFSETNSKVTLRQLRFLELASCNLTMFPEFLNPKNKLEVLDLSYNSIRGTIPRQLETWSNIQVIQLRSNMLQGSLPIPPPSTTVYRVSGNSLTGEISPSICNLHSLYSLELSNNNLSGKLPPCLANSSNSLTALKLQNNNLQGSIPNFCSTEGSRSIRLIDLSSNKLEGQVPRSLAKCKMLEFLDLGNNLIKDIFPYWLGTLPLLKVVVLKVNKFHGPITDAERDDSFPELIIIDLSYNHFSGRLPSRYLHNFNAMKVVDSSKLSYIQLNKSFDVQNYKVLLNFGFSITITNKGVQTKYTKIQEMLAAIDLSSNEFVGDIPELIGELKGLKLLNLSNNNLTGQIPTSLGELTELEALDLSQNKLTGDIPWQLRKLDFLSFFNVSNNHLSGTIPQGGQFDTFSSTSFDHNFGLSRKGSLEPPPPPPPRLAVDNDEGSNQFVDEVLRWVIVVAGYGVGLFIGVVMGQFVPINKLRRVLNSLGIRRLRF
ncbi:hypothetical protein FNV43_RR14925 [Rhamnella rubrinervis]|uniref:Receptor-like protein 12 n=1 Tax=Rhamnella rubrinervis TaxID=2594499 RepID=A0A8K0H3P2_9ROSA|nr:hypothetical protein FNV43_RR14925 [Rhamnella rubrinervis]